MNSDQSNLAQKPSSQPLIKRPATEIFLFKDIWYQIFLYSLATGFLIHVVAAVISFISLRKHKAGRYFPVVLVLVGLLYPLTGGMITSFFIAWIYTAAGYPMEKHLAFVYGAGQVLLLFVISFIRLYGTL